MTSPRCTAAPGHAVLMTPRQIIATLHHCFAWWWLHTASPALVLPNSCINLQDEAGQIIGAEVHDELDAWGKPISVHARVVINAGGPFSDSIRKMADEEVPISA